MTAGLLLAPALGWTWGCGGTDDGPDGGADASSDSDGTSGQDAGDNGQGDGSGGGGDANGDGDGGSEPLAVRPSSGCNGEATPPTGALSITVGALERTYVLSLPADYDPSHAYPLVFAFHGLGNDGAGVSGPWYFGIEQKGGTPSIFVYPDGLDAGDGTGWPNQDGRDVAFFDAMLDDLKTGYCVDENRVFSTGHSYGGIMSYTLACERAEVLRGVAPVAGSRWATNACSGPVAAWGAHGNPDPTVSYESGVSAMARILETNGCDTSAPAKDAGGCLTYECDPGYPVTWCEHAQGHDWPDFAAQSVKDFIDSF